MKRDHKISSMHGMAVSLQDLDKKTIQEDDKIVQFMKDLEVIEKDIRKRENAENELIRKDRQSIWWKRLAIFLGVITIFRFFRKTPSKNKKET